MERTFPNATLQESVVSVYVRVPEDPTAELALPHRPRPDADDLRRP